MLCTRQDLDQGGLPGSVFADEGVDLTGRDLEIDIVERVHAGKPHSDSRHAQQRFGHVVVIVDFVSGAF